MKLLFVMLMIGCSFQLVAQVKIVHVIIDTIEFRTTTEHDISITVGNQGFLNVGDVFENQVSSADSFPTFKSAITLAHDSSTIEIPIDAHGSHISLRNAYSLNTSRITISNLTIYNTRPADSVFTSIVYYNRIDGELEEDPYKLKQRVKGTRPMPPPTRVSIEINGEKYETDLEPFVRETEVMLGHGHKPQNPFDANGEYKRRRSKYFHIDKRKYQYGWKGIVELR